MNVQVIIFPDIEIAARTLYGEARGESYEGKKAVIHVMLNRRDKKVGDRDHTLASVSLRWRQFSTWNEGDPNRLKIQTVSFDDPDFLSCVQATCEAILENKKKIDPTNGSTHYLANWLYQKDTVDWARGKTPTVKIGNHVFYNNVD